MIIKNFRPVKLDKEGYRIECDDDGKYHRVLPDGNGGPEWYGSGEPVFKFDLYFAESRRHYETDYVRARDNRQAKRKIKHKYPWVERFEWGAAYAD